MRVDKQRRVLAAAEGSSTQIAVRHGVAVNTVSHWRTRFSHDGLPPRE